jgi:hypothetical protein
VVLSEPKGIFFGDVMCVSKSEVGRTLIFHFYQKPREDPTLEFSPGDLIGKMNYAVAIVIGLWCVRLFGACYLDEIIATVVT